MQDVAELPSGIGAMLDNSRPLARRPDRELGYRYGQEPHIFSAASTDPDIIAARRDVLMELALLENDPEKAELLEAALEFAATHFENLKPVYDHELSTEFQDVLTPAIEIYSRHVEKDENGKYVEDGGSVWRLPELLKSSQAACDSFVQDADNYPHLSRFLQEVQSHLSDCAPDGEFDVDGYIASNGHPRQTEGPLQELARGYSQERLAEGLRKIIYERELTPVQLAENSQPIALGELSHLKFKRSRQTLNSIDITNIPIALTGENGSGKTFLAEAIRSALVLAASIGHAPVNQASMPALAGVASHFRPEGGRHSDGLSAFGQEARDLGDTLAWLESMPTDQVKVVLLDEPFSSTDPAEQVDLLRRVIDRIRELGARVIMTTHSDVSSLEETGDVVPYHFTKDGGREHILEEGIGDSAAIEVARRCGLPEEILSRAESLLDPSALLDLSAVEAREFVPQPSIREQFGDDNPGLSWFLGSDRAEPCNLRYPGSKPFSVFGEILMNGSTNNPEDLALRQEFFRNLIDYPELEDLVDVLTHTMKAYYGLSPGRRNSIDADGQTIPAEPYFMEPLADIGMTLGLALRQTGERWWPTYNSLSKEEAHQSNQKYCIALTRTISEVMKDQAPPETIELITEYGDLIEWFSEADKRNDGKLFVTGEQRKKIYSFTERLIAAVGEPDTDGQTGRVKTEILDEIFMGSKGFSSLVIEGWVRELLMPASQSYVHYTTVNYPSLLSRLLSRVEPISIRDIKVSKHHQAFADLATACLRAEEKGVHIIGSDALAVLSYMTTDKDNDPLSRISKHLSSIGGDIAESLASYFDDDIRAKHFGFSSGKEMKRKIRKATEDITIPDKDQRGNTDIDSRRKQRARDFLGRYRLLAHRDILRRGGDTLVDQLFSLRGIAHDIRTGMDSYVDTAYSGGPIRIEKLSGNRFESTIPTDVSYDSIGGIDVISGPNMSGKTTFGESLYRAIASSQSFGLSPAKQAELPIYDKVIYVGRPKHDTSRGLSSFTADVENWKGVFEKLENAAPSFVFVDEPFSTTSSSYQQALTLSAVEWLAKRGHKVVIATHDHVAIDRLQKAKPEAAVEVSFHHLETSIDEHGALHFTRKFTEGVAPSWAVQVARSVGGEALARALG